MPKPIRRARWDARGLAWAGFAWRVPPSLSPWRGTCGRRSGPLTRPCPRAPHWRGTPRSGWPPLGSIELDTHDAPIGPGAAGRRAAPRRGGADRAGPDGAWTRWRTTSPATPGGPCSSSALGACWWPPSAAALAAFAASPRLRSVAFGAATGAALAASSALGADRDLRRRGRRRAPVLGAADRRPHRCGRRRGGGRPVR